MMYSYVFPYRRKIFHTCSIFIGMYEIFSSDKVQVCKEKKQNFPIKQMVPLSCFILHIFPFNHKNIMYYKCIFCIMSY